MPADKEIKAARAAVIEQLNNAPMTWVSEIDDPNDLQDIGVDGPINFEAIIKAVLDAAEKARTS
jgi:hypothetical protein